MKRGQPQRVSVNELGQALRVEYRRPGDKITRVHVFGPRVRVYVAEAGKHLIIAGGAMRVRDGEIHG